MREVENACLQAYRSHEHFGFSCTSKAPQLSRAGEPQDVQFWAKGGADAHSSAASGVLVHRLRVCHAFSISPGQSDSDLQLRLPMHVYV